LFSLIISFKIFSIKKIFNKIFFVLCRIVAIQKINNKRNALKNKILSDLNFKKAIIIGRNKEKRLKKIERFFFVLFFVYQIIQ
jgi:hypothetical protein